MSPTVRILRIAIPALAIGLVAAIQTIYFDRGLVPGDAFTYLAAGERLNDGHLLYALSPGDRPVGLNPPYWTVPLLSPPPIAVLFRPLAALPGEIGVYLWWAACIAAIVLPIIAMMRRRPILVGVAVLVLSIPIVYEIGVGNLNALLVAGVVGAWMLLARGGDAPAGAVMAGMAALKLTPALLAWWLITQRRWSGLRAFVIVGLVLLGISVLGAGLAAHLEYLGIVRQTSSTGTSELSLAGLARTIGVPEAIATLLPMAALLAGTALVWLLRDRPGPAYAVAVATMVFGSPVVNVNWFTVLIGALAPVVWPLPSATAQGTDAARAEDRSRPLISGVG